MLVELVSGRKMVRKIKQKPDSHMSSQIVHLHPSFSAANPPMRGPMAGPKTAAIPQTPMP